MDNLYGNENLVDNKQALYDKYNTHIRKKETCLNNSGNTSYSEGTLIISLSSASLSVDFEKMFF